MNYSDPLIDEIEDTDKARGSENDNVEMKSRADAAEEPIEVDILLNISEDFDVGTRWVSLVSDVFNYYLSVIFLLKPI